jgi:hypothetical protein
LPNWRDALPQIVVSLIGTTLVAALLNSLVLEINSPHIEISFRFQLSYPNIGVYYPSPQYNISFVNTGGSEATDVRLTMSYPGAKVSNASVYYTNENATLTYENESSLVVYLPRLSSGARTAVHLTTNETITSLERFRSPNEYSPKEADRFEPYSISATYDQGSDKYIPDNPSYIRYTVYNPQVLTVPLALVMSFLSFAILFRYKRSSSGRTAYGIFNDVITAKDTISKKPTKIIFFSRWDNTNTDTKSKIFTDYNNYKKSRRLLLQINGSGYSIIISSSATKYMAKP